MEWVKFSLDDHLLYKLIFSWPKLSSQGWYFTEATKGDCLRCPLVITSVTLKDSRNLQFSHLGCPLPRRKCLSALALFKIWSIQAYLPSICDSNQGKNACFYLREGTPFQVGNHWESNMATRHSDGPLQPNTLLIPDKKMKIFTFLHH